MELELVGSEEARRKDERSGVDVNGCREEDAGVALIHKKLQTVKGREELGLDPTDRVFIKGGGATAAGRKNRTKAGDGSLNPLVTVTSYAGVVALSADVP